MHSRAMTPAVTAAILAGGRATRLDGADKSSLVVSGARIIERQLAALSGVAAEILMVSCRGDVEEQCAALGIPVIRDAVAGAGPLGGLCTALESARHPWVLAVACDMPFVTSALFELLVSAIDEDVDAVVPRSSKGLEPLCAVYARRTARVFRRRLEAGQWRLGDVMTEVRVREIPRDALAGLDDDGRLFENVNTPHDYARAREVKQKR
ncbi:MAG TPA: molybdenum cofactor guanylyltransferase [Vicinamibacterales bacterium]|nr:molybdenum cofactor guanylyltransferase [Vicinamibacterales bacterium]